ncbi:MAG TPA: hypothetical protein VIV12_08270 [Streptosporangiaceae bacterium]
MIPFQQRSHEAGSATTAGAVTGSAGAIGLNGARAAGRARNRGRAAPLTLGRRGDRPEPTNTWRHRVQVRAQVLLAELDVICSSTECHGSGGAHEPAYCRSARKLLQEAEDFIREPSNVVSWWSGKQYEGTLLRLHAAEVEITRLMTPVQAQSRADTVLALARPLCPGNDPRLLTVQQLTAKKYENAPDPRLPSALADLLQAAGYVEEERAARSRNFRNRLIRAGAVVLGLLVLALIAAWVVPGSIPVCGQLARQGQTALTSCHRDGTSHVPADALYGDVALVMLFGMLGAALPMAARLQQFGGSWNPYGLPFYQEIVKLPIGALVAVGGLLLIHTNIAPLFKPPSDWNGVVADAVLLGIAQLVFTRAIDQRVSKMLAAMPDEEETKQLEKVSGPQPPL